MEFCCPIEQAGLFAVVQCVWLSLSLHLKQKGAQAFPAVLLSAFPQRTQQDTQ